MKKIFRNMKIKTIKCHVTNVKKDKTQKVLMRIYRKTNSCTLLVKIQINITAIIKKVYKSINKLKPAAAGQAFGEALAVLLRAPASHVSRPWLSPGSTSNPGFLPVHTLRGSR